jgi:protein TonB
MQTAEILSSSFLDILFENRNKDYGAYDLRKSYNKRLGTALIILISTLALLATLFLLGNGRTEMPKIISVIPPNVITVISQPDKIIIPQIKKVSSSVATQTVHNATPLIVKDNTKPLPPPDITEIENANTGFKASTGNSNIDMINPPTDIPGSNVLAAPTSQRSSEDSIRITVEIEASFPGGISEWSKYLKRTIERNQGEFTPSDFGTCLIRFVVDKNGNVSNVIALSMQNTRLAEVAIKAIKNGPRWIPAIQNGHKVSAYRTQPITVIEENE